MNRLYKYSQFNLIVKEDNDKVLLYNTYSLNYRWLDKADFADINESSSIDLFDVPEFLADEGFIVPSETNEIKRLKDDVLEYQNNADFMFLSIFTTLACNYRCVYCFEKEQLCQTEHMTIETADEIIDFIKRRYEEHNFSKPLKIKWFGGEPLLNMEIIRYISNELVKNNIKYNAKLYTNGRLLTKELALELKELGVSDEVVIPIDGLAPTYAEIKGCKEDDFYTVLKNIKECEDILKIKTHINVSEKTFDDVQRLFDLMREDYRIKSPILALNVLPLNNGDSQNRGNNISYSKFQQALDIIVKDQSNMLNRNNAGCEGRQLDYYVIGTKGEIYICEHLVGQEKYIVGNIKEQSNRIDRTGTIWDSNRVIDDCQGCKILPICLGYCTTQRYLDNIDCNKEIRIDNIKKRVLRFIQNK